MPVMTSTVLPHSNQDSILMPSRMLEAISVEQADFQASEVFKISRLHSAQEVLEDMLMSLSSCLVPLVGEEGRLLVDSKKICKEAT